MADVPIKDQVCQIFEEHGKLSKDQTSQRKKSHHHNLHSATQSKYLTIDNFVKITKDICNFPTFFNKPLYKRILYLWNTQSVKSDRGKMILWDEYYNVNGDELDTGIDSDD